MKKLLSSIIIVFTLSGCISTNEIPESRYEHYDVNSLKSTDVTYQVSDMIDIPVIIDDNTIMLKFDTNWYLVHRDWIKTFNENQDTLIDILDSKKKEKITQWEQKKATLTRILWITFLCLIGIILIAKAIKYFKK